MIIVKVYRGEVNINDDVSRLMRLCVLLVRLITDGDDTGTARLALEVVNFQ